MFITCLVPLQLTIKETGEIVWLNEKPSSTLLCRPVRFRFVKETKEVLIEELQYIKSQDCRPTVVAEGSYAIEHQREITMVDGKVATALSDVTNASNSCSMCGCTPKNMNDLPKVLIMSQELDQVAFQYGLSTLHAWIRSMECCLNLSYRMEFKKNQARGQDLKEKVGKKKVEIQAALVEKLGIVVDRPKSGGSGSSNNGNCARRFFRNYTVVAGILGLEEELLKRLFTILCTFSCFQEINADKLEQYCLETAELFVEKYPWFSMPQGLHKILIHSHQVVRSKNLPIGMLSEEAQEANNKEFKATRE